MKETKKSLIERWKLDYIQLKESVDHQLKKGKQLEKLLLERTVDGFIDLRGYSSPKRNRARYTQKGIAKPYVESSLKIKNARFINIDFSLADLECCEFANCHFSNCKFVETRLQGAFFWGCRFKSTHFEKSNLADTRFLAKGLFLRRLIDNFQEVTFEKVNFSRSFFHNQILENTNFSNCKTGSASFEKCHLKYLTFSGRVFNLTINSSRDANHVDFKEAEIESMNFTNQSIEGFTFPSSQDYFLFSNMPEQLKELKTPTNLTQTEIKLWNEIVSIWSSYKDKIQLADTNWLKPEEKEIGRQIIRELKRTDHPKL